MVCVNFYVNVFHDQFMSSSPQSNDLTEVNVKNVCEASGQSIGSRWAEVINYLKIMVKLRDKNT